MTLFSYIHDKARELCNLRQLLITKEMKIFQSWALLQWTYPERHARVSQCIRDGDVEHGLMGVFSHLSPRREVSHLHNQFYYFNALVEL